jgi:TPR repeat protein
MVDRPVAQAKPNRMLWRLLVVGVVAVAVGVGFAVVLTVGTEPEERLVATSRTDVLRELAPTLNAPAIDTTAVSDEPADAQAALPGDDTPAVATADPTKPPPAPEPAAPIAAAQPQAVQPRAERNLTTALRPLDALAAGDFNAFVDQLRDAAAGGDAKAAHDLAGLYLTGQGVGLDYTEAARLFKRAAETGIANAQFNYAVMLAYGWGLDADPEAALQWYQAAANQSHPEAQFNLALSYLRGAGVDPDLWQAAHWFEQAAQESIAEANMELGRLYEAGLDGAPDLEQARLWYERAQLTGVDGAGEALVRVINQLAGEQQVARAPVSGAPTGDGTPVARAEIREIQRLLNGLNFDAGPEDGVMGEKTRTAIRSFQQAVGLPIDGRATRGLLKQIHSRQTRFE